MKNLIRFVNETVDVADIHTLPEDITVQPKLRDHPNWKLDKVRFLVQYLPECQLNLPFFNPYIKSNKALFTYRLLMKTFERNSEDENNRLIIEVKEYLVGYKKKLYEELEQNGERIEKVLPLFHMLIHLFTYNKCSDKEKMKELA